MIDTDDEPTLLDGVVLLGGEARLRHVYCRSGAVDDEPLGFQLAYAKALEHFSLPYPDIAT